VPTVTSLARIAQLAKPLTYWLGLSVQDLLGLMNGWDRAIQYRDGLGHVFHAEIGISPSIVVNLTKAFGLAADKGAKGAALVRSGARSNPAAAPQTPSAAAPAASGALGKGVSALLKSLSGVLGGGPKPPTGGGSGSSSTSSLSGLLGYLLGR
jgi:hypothetical protein